MSVEIQDDHFMVCNECYMAIANDDFTGLDAYMDEDESAVREAEIRDSIDSVKGTIAAGDSEKDEEFSMVACECCLTNVAGTRHHCVVLGGGDA